MSERPEPVSGTPDSEKSPEELRAEISDVRDDLGETVEQLAAKADVKGRVQEDIEHRKEAAREKAEEVKERVTNLRPEDAKQAASTGAEKAKERPVIPAVAVAVLLLAVVVLRRRRRS